MYIILGNSCLLYKKSSHKETNLKLEKLKKTYQAFYFKHKHTSTGQNCTDTQKKKC